HAPRPLADPRRPLQPRLSDSRPPRRAGVPGPFAGSPAQTTKGDADRHGVADRLRRLRPAHRRHRAGALPGLLEAEQLRHPPGAPARPATAAAVHWPARSVAGARRFGIALHQRRPRIGEGPKKSMRLGVSRSQRFLRLFPTRKPTRVDVRTYEPTMRKLAF